MVRQSDTLKVTPALPGDPSAHLAPLTVSVTLLTFPTLYLTYRSPFKSQSCLHPLAEERFACSMRSMCLEGDPWRKMRSEVSRSWAAAGDPWPTASRKTATSVLYPQGTELCQWSWKQISPGPQVANTRPTGWIRPCTLFPPAGSAKLLLNC